MWKISDIGPADCIAQMTPQTLDYASEIRPKPWHVGAGYGALIAINALSLGVGTIELLWGIDDNGVAKFSGIFLGGPAVVAQILIGAFPAWLYLGCNHKKMTPWTKSVLVILSLAPAILGAVGFYFALNVPPTHSVRW
jgi:hypothetical protein